jgi:hypothetical protein
MNARELVDTARKMVAVANTTLTMDKHPRATTFNSEVVKPAA